MIESERDREEEFKICAEEKLLLVNMLFEEINFKATLGGKGCGGEQKEEKFPICAADKQKVRAPCCFLLKVGMRTVLSSEKERRDLEGTQIWTSSAKY